MTSLKTMLLPDADAPERVAVSSLPDGRWLITDIPCYSARFGFLDVVLATEDSKTGLIADLIVESSDWSTYGIVLRASDSSSIGSALVLLEKIGCSIMTRPAASGGLYISVAVPPRAIEEAEKLLEDGHARGLWLAGPVLSRSLVAST